MPLIKMETTSIQELEKLYLLTADHLRGTGLRLVTPLTNFNNLFDNDNETNLYLKMIGDLINALFKDGNDILWRRKLMEKANSSIDLSSFILEPVSSKFSNFSNKELLAKLKSSTFLFKNEIPRQYIGVAESDSLKTNAKNKLELSDQELSNLLYELARRSLIEPGLASQIIKILVIKN